MLTVGVSLCALLVSIVLGLIGAVLGTWLARKAGMGEILAVSVGGQTFPIVWSIIGAALFALSDYTGQEQFASAGHAAFHHERSLYCESSRNWRDLRMDSTVGRCSTAWCHSPERIA